MDLSETKAKIKQIVFETTNIDPNDINDEASFVEDLKLDSLTLLEIAVNIDQEFALDLPEDEMRKFTSIAVSAALVKEHQSTKALV